VSGTNICLAPHNRVQNYDTRKILPHQGHQKNSIKKISAETKQQMSAKAQPFL